MPLPRSANRWALALLALCLASPRVHADVSSWQALPAETVFAMRIPNGQAVYDALAKNTKLGKVLFKEERMKAIREAMEQGDPAQWKKMQDELARFEMKFEDLPLFFSGETGMAVTLTPPSKPGEDPRGVILLWTQPGEEMAGKFMKMIDLAIDDPDNKNKPARVDFTIGDAKVIHLAIAEQGLPELPDFPADFENMTPEEIQEFFKKRQQARENAKPSQVDQTNMLISRQGGRILMAVYPPQNKKAIAQLKEAGQPIDWNKATQLDALTESFARFLTSHKTGGEFLEKVANAKGLQESLPAGHGILEVVGNFHSALDWAKGQSPQAGRILAAMGLDKIGSLALKITIDGQAMRSGAFFEAPAPRTGLFDVLEQSTQPAEVPAWVPASAMEYVHLGLDLGALYTKIKQIVIQEVGPEAQQGFNMAEFQVKNFTQSDVATVLSSIGSRHMIVSYPFTMMKVPGGDGEVPSQRQAIVWQLKNEQVWKNIFTTIEAFAGDNARKVEEQGFTGFRVDQGPVKAGLFMGKGFLTLTMGDGVSEEILSALANPPQGANALRNTPSYERARRLIAPKAGLSYQYSDMGKSAVMIRKMIDTVMSQAAAQGDDDLESQKVMALIKQLMPTEKEVEGVFGVGAGQSFLTEGGIVMESLVELPAP